MHDPQAYKPISDYGAIGNLRTVALVGIDGSIDWCCLPVFDAPSTFAAILDSRSGGHFRIAPVKPTSSSQRYLEHTNVLETAFDTEGGRLLVTDFMPLIGSIDNNDPHEAPEEIHRSLQALSGEVEVELEWVPRFDYGREPVTVTRTPGGFYAHAGEHELSLGGLPVRGEILSDANGQFVRARFSIRPGERMAIVTRWGTPDDTAAVQLAHHYLDETVDAWHRWARKDNASGDRSWAGHWNEHVIRSELALKLLTFAPTGAMVAAPTTSLPEWIGSVRNWDYRYSWIRDSGLAAQAFNAMGHASEAASFVRWVEEVSRKRGEEERGLHIMYDVRGSHCLPEAELPHFEGYRGSSPVRYGNEAATQVQLDVYGELISAAYEQIRTAGTVFEPEILRFLTQLANEAEMRRDDKDSGIWEIRSGPDHFVHSKVMIWTALNRAACMVDQGIISGDAARWRMSQEIVKADVLAKGYSHELEAFTMAYGSDELDAANLLIPLLEFLSPEDPRVQNTIDRTLERLTESDLVFRYLTDDGLPGPEGAFILCTFWLVDALTLSGRLDEAYRIYDGLAGRVNHLGLLSEQIDPHTGDFLGNFPQAFSHIGMINSALYLAHMEGRKTPLSAPIGTREHRMEVGNPV